MSADPILEEYLKHHHHPEMSHEALVSSAWTSAHQKRLETQPPVWNWQRCFSPKTSSLLVIEAEWPKSNQSAANIPFATDQQRKAKKAGYTIDPQSLEQLLSLRHRLLTQMPKNGKEVIDGTYVWVAVKSLVECGIQGVETKLAVYKDIFQMVSTFQYDGMFLINWRITPPIAVRIAIKKGSPLQN
jgi:hypothetical protein